MKKIYLSALILFTQFISHAQFWSKVGTLSLGSSVNVVYNDSATNSLYLGGDFTPSGLARIAKWDGTNYSGLGTGMDAGVNAIVKYNGNLYAGGVFGVAGGVIAPRLAKWNGSSWSTVAGAMTTGQVDAFCVYNGELYVGGYFNFTTPGGAAVHIAKWNGTTWAPLGTGMDNQVKALCVYNGELYAGGEFTNAGGTPVNHIAKWNGTSWAAVGTGMNLWLDVLYAWNGDLYAGGRFTTAGGNPANYIAKWNGSAWSALGTGMDNFVYTINYYNGELYAGGYFTTAGGASAGRIARWNGSSWKNVNEGFNGNLNSMAVYKSQLYVGGSMGYIVPYFAVWDNIPPGTNRFQKVYKGANASPNSESVFDVEQTVDWGYVVAGHSTSYGAGNGDAYIIKTDTAGVIAWSKVVGGPQWETARSAVTTSDGSIIFTGLTQSYGAGSNDVFAVSMDKDGNTNWKYAYGTAANEQGWAMKQNSNGELIMGGTTDSDPLLINASSFGGINWAKKYVTAAAEEINSVELTSSGGYILAGTTGTTPNINMYVMNIAANGNVLWDRSFGGTGEEKGFMAKQTMDGGFIVAGGTSSYGLGYYDGYLIKLNAAGNVVWSKTYGTTQYEELRGIEQTGDGGYLLTGSILYTPAGTFDVLSIKITSDGSLLAAKTYGGPNWENMVNTDKSSDGGLIMVGQTNSFPYSGGSDFNIYMVKTDSLLNSGSCHQNNQPLTVGSPASVSSTPGAIASNAGLTVTGPLVTSEANAPFTTYGLTPSVSISQTNVTCNAGTNGQASVSHSGGISPFTYLWSTNASTPVISNLSANNYTLTITDSTFCSVTQTVSITQPAAFNVSYSVTNVSCFGGNNGAVDVTVSGSTSPYTYNWSPGGATTQDISNLSINNYSLTITDANACTSSMSATVSNSIAPIPICIVTVDSVLSDKNHIVWEKPVTTAIDSFRIYRNISTLMTRIGAQSYTATSTFIDATPGVSPKTQVHEYAISIVDSCGNESALSPTHKTIHQQTPVYSGPPHRFDLSWSDYQGFSFTDYEIWRDSNNTGNWQKIGLVPYGLSTTYTDINVPTDSARYRIQIVPAQPCIATIKNPEPQATTVSSGKSNASDRLTNPTSVAEISDNPWVIIYPNPSNGTFTIQMANENTSTIKIYNVLGELVYQTKLNAQKSGITIPGITKGIYQLQIVTSSGIINRKIVISG